MTADPRALVTNAQILVAIYDVATADNPFRDEAIEALNDAATFIESTLPVWDAWQTAKPPCTTCGGTKGAWAPSGRLGGQHPRSADKWQPCPACVDHPGVQPFTEWVAGVIGVNSQRNHAIVQAVTDHAHPESPVSEDVRRFCEWLLTSPLRQIGGIR